MKNEITLDGNKFKALAHGKTTCIIEEGEIPVRKGLLRIINRSDPSQVVSVLVTETMQDQLQKLPLKYPQEAWNMKVARDQASDPDNDGSSGGASVEQATTFDFLDIRRLHEFVNVSSMANVVTAIKHDTPQVTREKASTVRSRG